LILLIFRIRSFDIAKNKSGLFFLNRGDYVAAQPKDVLHEKRILFFPEWNQKEYYKIIFGRILFWILWPLIATYCYFLGQDYLAWH
jgi:hypothetical protein